MMNVTGWREWLNLKIRTLKETCCRQILTVEIISGLGDPHLKIVFDLEECSFMMMSHGQNGSIYFSRVANWGMR
jgi:hypothetical protein